MQPMPSKFSKCGGIFNILPLFAWFWALPCWKFVLKYEILISKYHFPWKLYSPILRFFCIKTKSWCFFNPVFHVIVDSSNPWCKFTMVYLLQSLFGWVVAHERLHCTGFVHMVHTTWWPSNLGRFQGLFRAQFPKFRALNSARGDNADHIPIP